MERRTEVERQNVMYVEKTSRPTWGGWLLIIAGIINLLGGIGVALGGAALQRIYGFTGTAFTGVPLIIIGLITLIGGIVALMRRAWWLALIGGILAVLPSPGWIFGVPGIILVSLAKPEFDMREAIVGERRGVAERVAAPTPVTSTSTQQPRATPVSGGEHVSASTLQVYLKGMDYPAHKEQIADYAKSHGAPNEVMMYMDRLPNREYRSPTDVEEEFGKIK